MKRPLLLAAPLLGSIAAVWWFVWRDDGERLPDEKRTAMILLEKSQSGPGYFHPADSCVPDEQGIFWLSPARASGQIDRVLRERKLDEPMREKLTKLIEEVAEPHPSRTVGGSRINVARLNVALDAMK